MKAKLKGHIAALTALDGDVTITLGNTVGKTDPMKNSAQAQGCYLSGSFKLKASVANEMKIGSIITFTVSDEEE